MAVNFTVETFDALQKLKLELEIGNQTYPQVNFHMKPKNGSGRKHGFPESYSALMSKGFDVTYLGPDVVQECLAKLKNHTKDLRITLTKWCPFDDGPTTSVLLPETRWLHSIFQACQKGEVTELTLKDFSLEEFSITGSFFFHEQFKVDSFIFTQPLINGSARNGEYRVQYFASSLKVLHNVVVRKLTLNTPLTNVSTSQFEEILKAIVTLVDKNHNIQELNIDKIKSSLPENGIDYLDKLFLIETLLERNKVGTVAGLARKCQEFEELQEASQKAATQTEVDYPSGLTEIDKKKSIELKRRREEIDSLAASLIEKGHFEASYYLAKHRLWDLATAYGYLIKVPPSSKLFEEIQYFIGHSLIIEPRHYKVIRNKQMIADNLSKVGKVKNQLGSLDDDFDEESTGFEETSNISDQTELSEEDDQDKKEAKESSEAKASRLLLIIKHLTLAGNFEGADKLLTDIIALDYIRGDHLGTLPINRGDGRSVGDTMASTLHSSKKMMMLVFSDKEKEKKYSDESVRLPMSEFGTSSTSNSSCSQSSTSVSSSFYVDREVKDKAENTQLSSSISMGSFSSSSSIQRHSNSAGVQESEGTITTSTQTAPTPIQEVYYNLHLINSLRRTDQKEKIEQAILRIEALQVSNHFAFDEIVPGIGKTLGQEVISILGSHASCGRVTTILTQPQVSIVENPSASVEEIEPSIEDQRQMGRNHWLNKIDPKTARTKEITVPPVSFAYKNKIDKDKNDLCASNGLTRSLTRSQSAPNLVTNKITQS